MIRNIKIILSYDGSEFSGWQLQKDKRTIQGEIELAIYKITKRPSRLVCAGRTDSGVHAYCQVANFLTTSNIPPKAFVFHLNKYLPDDILVLSSEEVDLDFHSRFSAKNKTYRYVLDNSKFFHPSLRRVKGHYAKELNMEKMLEASKVFLGRHDFKSFMKYGYEGNTVRSIEKINIYRKDEDVYFEFTGESFLHNQIRIMVGALVNIGRGHWNIEKIEDLLINPDRQKSAVTFPPAGLYLLEISY